MLLYHYSSKLLKKISVKFFAQNSYTFNDKRRSDLNRSFFYTDKKDKENLIEANYLHICEVDESKIYSLSDDREGIINKFYPDLDTCLKKIKAKKYIGIKYNVGFEVVNLFIDIAPKKVMTVK